MTLAKLPNTNSNIQKSVLLLNITNELKKFEQTTTFTIAPKKKKKWRNKVNQRGESMYNENYKIQLKEIKRQSMFVDWKTCGKFLKRWEYQTI